MGVKSTVSLTRLEAIEKYADLKAKLKRRKHEAKAIAMGKRELEDEIERMNDEANDGEGYENYVIVEEQS